MNVETMKKKPPLVSVGIPSYNRPEGLRRTLECITQQTYQNLEIIISDNCSPNPEEEAVCREFMKKDSRIIYFRQQENKGAAFNFRFVLEKATGDYFMWAADDDKWDDRFVETCILKIADHSSVMTGFKTIYLGTGREDPQILPDLSPELSIYQNLRNHLLHLVPSLIYGIHKRSDIMWCLNSNIKFDFFDCFFVSKLLLDGNGVVLVRNYDGYRAGIVGDQYVVKPANPRGNRLLQYYPFLFKHIALIAFCRKLSLVEKIRLIDIVLIVVLGLFVAKEKEFRPVQVRLAKALMILKRRLVAVGSVARRIVCSFMKSVKRSPVRTKEPDVRLSYSQSGEDLIVKYLFVCLRIGLPSYLDIGTHHPISGNNTYLFYQQGCSGVCVEPHPTLFAEIKKKRRRDICLNVGLGAKNQANADFYVLSAGTLSTFSKEEAERIVSYGNQKIERVLEVSMVNVNDVIESNFSFCPNFISLDVEGLDFEVLEAIEFSKYRPEVFCVETLTYTEDNSEKKRVEIVEYMEKRGYMNYADTYINTIFVDEEKWRKRK